LLLIDIDKTAGKQQQATARQLANHQPESETSREEAAPRFDEIAE